MSCNVYTWNTKRLHNLVIPWVSFFKNPKREFHPRFSQCMNGSLINSDWDCMLKGDLIGDSFRVTVIDICGEASGTFLREVLEPALADSTGELEAVRIWEGGDSIDRLIVKDGVVTTEQIEL